MKKGWVLLLVFCLGIVDATSYYVSNNGNDSWDGLSDATAWRTVGKVNGFKFSVGDDVYFECGDVWTNDKLIIDWNGTSENRSIIGAYCDNGKFGVDDIRPVIEGTDGSYPPGEWSSLVSWKTDYVTIENLHIRNSAQLGIVATGKYGIVDSCVVENTYLQALNGEKSTNLLVKNSDFSNADNMGNGAVITFPMSVGARVIGNKIHESKGWSEGINFYRSTDMEAAYNTVWDTWAALVYMDQAVRPSLHHNLLFYTDNKTFWRYSESGAPGIWATNEPGYIKQFYGARIYNNFVVNANDGFNLGGSRYNATLKDSYVVNNVFIPSPLGTCFKINNLGHSNSFIQNNICVDDTLPAQVPGHGITWSNNLWTASEEEIDDDAKGSGDIYSGNPNFSNSVWNGSKLLSVEDFILRVGSDAINAGIVLNEEFGLDFFGNTRGADGAWDIGAIEYGGQVPQTKTCQNLGGVCCSACVGFVISGASDCVTCCSSCEVVVLNSSYEIVFGRAIVDGYVSEFSNVNEIILRNSLGTVGEYKLMWDSYGLYISGEVMDSEVNSKVGVRDGNLWDDDSLEIIFDVLNKGGTLRNENDYKFIVNSDGIELDDRGTNKSWDVDFDSAVRIVDGGYVVEVAIPWSVWGISAFENDDWGMEVAMNDLNDDGVRIQSVWVNRNSGGVNDPDGWGEIVFIGNKVSLSDIFSKIVEWKAGRVSLNDVFVVIRGWGEG